jgi:hypothetical protein
VVVVAGCVLFLLVLLRLRNGRSRQDFDFFICPFVVSRIVIGETIEPTIAVGS